jgi:hypothetical protein
MNVIEGGGFPLLGLDLWEHAYYLKYRNKRDEYITNFWKVVNWDFVSKMYEMKTETRLAESTKFKEILSEGKSEKCGPEESEAVRVMFNVNRQTEQEYKTNIDRILKEVFHEYWADRDNQGNLAGIYNFEKPGRSVLNKLNTNYTVFCILLKDINKVIHSIDDKKQPINFIGKSPKDQISEITRFIKALDYFKFRIFNRESGTFQNLMRALVESDSAGEKREEITVSIINRFFKSPIATKTGNLGDEDDMLKGIDTKIEKDGKTYTGQIKGFKERIDKDDKIILKGTGKVKMYSTDWMIFQKGRNVLIFNKKPNIIGGNFVFPKDGLLYDIK